MSNILKHIGREFRLISSSNYLSSAWFIATLSVRRQYRESFLGILWSLLQPAIQITVLAAVFSTILRFNMKDHVFYLMSGMLPWAFILATFTGGANCLITRVPILKRCVLPKTMLILSEVLVALYNFSISFLVMYLLLATFFGKLSLWVLLMPLIALPLILTGLSGAVVLAYTAPYFRDVSHLITVIMGVLFWTVPVVYPLEVVPEYARHYFEYNPLYMIIRPIQLLIYEGALPPMELMLHACGVASVALLAAFVVQRTLRRNVIYYI